MAFKGFLGFDFSPLFSGNLSLSPLETPHTLQPNQTTPGTFLLLLQQFYMPFVVTVVVLFVLAAPNGLQDVRS